MTDALTFHPPGPLTILGLGPAAAAGELVEIRGRDELEGLFASDGVAPDGRFPVADAAREALERGVPALRVLLLGEDLDELDRRLAAESEAPQPFAALAHPGLILLPGVLDESRQARAIAPFRARGSGLVLLDVPGDHTEASPPPGPRGHQAARFAPWLLDESDGDQPLSAALLAAILIETRSGPARLRDPIAPLSTSPELRPATVFEPERRRAWLRAGVNLFTPPPHRGRAETRLYGDRTASEEPGLARLGQTRLMLALVDSLVTGLRARMTRPRDAALMAEIQSAVEEGLSRLRRAGELLGETDTEAFRLECGEDLHPPQFVTPDDLVMKLEVALESVEAPVPLGLCLWTRGFDIALGGS